MYTYIKEAPESVALPQEIADALPYGRRPTSKEALVKSSSGMDCGARRGGNRIGHLRDGGLLG